MSVEAIDTHHGHNPLVAHQFETMEQQNDTYQIGMWAFLVTEIMFFGALFLAYTLYRHAYPWAFWVAHHKLNAVMGGINTIVLLTSSFTMALGVRAAQLQKKTPQLIFLLLTVLCACAFLVIKYFEYSHKFEEHLFPGTGFHFEMESSSAIKMAATPIMGYQPTPLVSQDKAQMFFNLYFAMTGLHGIHVLVGILLIGACMFKIGRNHKSMRYFMPVELVGLYWHFVDIVWIFLFPLFYLLPKP